MVFILIDKVNDSHLYSYLFQRWTEQPLPVYAQSKALERLWSFDVKHGAYDLDKENCGSAQFHCLEKQERGFRCGLLAV